MLSVQVRPGITQETSREYQHKAYETFNPDKSAEFKVVMVTSMRGVQETAATIKSLNASVDVIWADAPLTEVWKGIAWQGYGTKVHSLLPYLRSQAPNQLIMYDPTFSLCTGLFC